MKIKSQLIALKGVHSPPPPPPTQLKSIKVYAPLVVGVWWDCIVGGGWYCTCRPAGLWSFIVETESIRSLRVQNKAMVFFYMHLKLQSALLFYSGKMIF